MYILDIVGNVNNNHERHNSALARPPPYLHHIRNLIQQRQDARERLDIRDFEREGHVRHLLLVGERADAEHVDFLVRQQ